MFTRRLIMRATLLEHESPLVQRLFCEMGFCVSSQGCWSLARWETPSCAKQARTWCWLCSALRVPRLLQPFLS